MAVISRSHRAKPRYQEICIQLQIFASAGVRFRRAGGVREPVAVEAPMRGAAVRAAEPRQPRHVPRAARPLPGHRGGHTAASAAAHGRRRGQGQTSLAVASRPAHELK